MVKLTLTLKRIMNDSTICLSNFLVEMTLNDIQFGGTTRSTRRVEQMINIVETNSI
jgi:hypothetical protein